MPIMETLKNIYYSFEDRYYDVMDWLDGKGVPVYKVIDAIEANNIPSFPVFVVFLLLVLYGLFTFVLGPVLAPSATLSLSVVDASDKAIEGATAKLQHEGLETPVTKETDADGKASFSNAPKQKDIRVTISKDGYKDERRSLNLAKDEESLKVTLIELARLVTKTVKLMKQGTSELVTSPVRLFFSCSNNRTFQEEKTITGGIGAVDVPDDCGQLNFSLPAGFSSQQNSVDATTGDSAEIFLLAAAAGKGNVVVSVFDETNKALAGIGVNLHTETGVNYATKATTAAGTASFENVEAGRYYVSTYDTTGTYAEFSGFTAGEIKEVRPDSDTDFRVSLDKRSVGKVKVEVVDKSTGEAVKAASVSLLKNGKLIRSEETGADGKAEFAVGENVSYQLNVDAPNYLLSSLDNVRPATEFVKVELELATAANSQGLLVSVLDENNKPVEDAKLILKKQADGTQVGSELTTGVDGKATFDRLEEDTYYVYAYKPGFGDKTSDTITLSKRVRNELKVVLPIGNGNFQVKVLNEDLQPVAGAKVRVMDYATRQPIAEQITTADGIVKLPVRADKFAYAFVEAANFLPYTSVPMQLAKDVTLERSVVLIRDAPSANVAVQGLYANNELVRDALSAGGRYTARMLMTLPRQSTFNEAGLHFRTGSDQARIIDRDPVYITGIRAAAPKIVRGTTYNPYTGAATDLQHLTNGNAKWSDVIFAEPLPGVYEIETDLQVREGARLGEPAELHYRGWGRTGSYVRFPADTILGSSEAVAEREALYANTRTMTVSVGPSNICQDNFCSVQSIEDIQAKLLTAVIDEYPARISNNYRLNFFITGIAERAMPNAELHISNATSAITFGNYKITDVTDAIKQGLVDGSELVLPIGNISKDDDVFGQLDFMTRRDGTTDLVVSIVSEGEKVFEKKIKLVISAAQEMKVQILPKVIVPFVNNNLIVKVTTADEKSALSDATVTIRRDGAVQTTGRTNSEGIFSYTLLPSPVGSVVTVEVERPGFRTVKMEVKLTENIVEFLPKEISELLTIGTVPEKERAVVLRNLTDIPLIVSAVNASGDFKSFVKVQQREDATGKELLVNSDVNMSVVLGLTPKASGILEATRLKGSLDVVVASPTLQRQWTSKLPLDVRIGFGREVDDPACFSVFPSEWKIFTHVEGRKLDLAIRNNCTVADRPVPLRNLQIRVQSLNNERELGQFEVSSDIEGSRRVQLSNKFEKFAEVMRENSENSLNLSFKPEVVSAGSGQMQIVVKAANFTESGEEPLEQRIKVDASISNLSQCVEFVGADNLSISSDPFNTGFGAINNRFGFGRGLAESQYTGPYGSPNYDTGYGGYPDNLYRRGQTFAGADPNSNYAFGTATGSASFTVKNSCVAPVQINLSPSTGIVVDKSGFTIGPNNEEQVNVSSSYLVGQQSISVRGRIATSTEPSVELKKVNVTVENELSRGYRDCISINPAGKLAFNELIAKAKKISVINTCYNQGVRINPGSNAIDFTNKDLIDTWRFLGENMQGAGDGRVTQTVSFEVFKKVRDDVRAAVAATPRFPSGEESPFTQLANMRVFFTAGYYRIEAPANIIVNFTTRYGGTQALDFPITIEDFFELAPFAERVIKYGDPNFQPHQCVNQNALDLKSYFTQRGEKDGCIPLGEFKLNTFQFRTFDNYLTGPLWLYAKEVSGKVQVYPSFGKLPQSQPYATPLWATNPNYYGQGYGSQGPWNPAYAGPQAMQAQEAAKQAAAAAQQAPQQTQPQEFVPTSGEVGGCGTTDNIVSLDETSFNEQGLKVSLALDQGARELIVTIDKTGWNKRRVDVEKNITGKITRAVPPKTGPFSLPLKFCLTEAEAIVPTEVPRQEGCPEGATGAAALKESGLDRLLFDWRWKDSYKNEFSGKELLAHVLCDGKDGFFCDATQFSISLNEKAKKVKAFGDDAAELCLGPDDLCKNKDAENLYRFAIEQLKIGDEAYFLTADGKLLERKPSETELMLLKSNLRKLAGIKEVKSQENKVFDAVWPAAADKQAASVLEKIKSNQKLSKDIVVEVKVGGDGELTDGDLIGDLTNLVKIGNSHFMNFEGYYKYRSKLSPTIDYALLSKLNKSLHFHLAVRNSKDLSAEEKEIVLKEGAVDKSLVEKLNAVAGHTNFEQFYNENIKFKANLINDGYNQNFRADFASLYSDGAMAGFADWTFAPESIDAAGIYDVVLNYKWAEGTEGDKVEVKLAPTKDAVPNYVKANLLFTLPFDGKVGYANAGGRVGYGTGFGAVAEKDKLYIAAYPEQEEQDVEAKTLSGGMKPLIFNYHNTMDALSGGKILEIKNDAIVFTPSDPVALKAVVSRSSSDYAGLLYKIEPAEIGGKAKSLLAWTVESDETFGKASGETLGDNKYPLNYLCKGASPEEYSGVILGKPQGAGKTILNGITYVPVVSGGNVTRSAALRLGCGKDNVQVAVAEAEFDSAGGFTGVATPRTASASGETTTAIELNKNSNALRLRHSLSLGKLVSKVKDGVTCVKVAENAVKFFWNHDKFKITESEKPKEGS